MDKIKTKDNYLLQNLIEVFPEEILEALLDQKRNKSSKNFKKYYEEK